MESRRSMVDVLADIRIPVFTFLVILVIFPLIIWILELRNPAFGLLSVYIAILSLHLPRDDIQYQFSETLLTISMVMTRLALLNLIMVPFFKVIKTMTREAEMNTKK